MDAGPAGSSSAHESSSPVQCPGLFAGIIPHLILRRNFTTAGRGSCPPLPQTAVPQPGRRFRTCAVFLRGSFLEPCQTAVSRADVSRPLVQVSSCRSAPGTGLALLCGAFVQDTTFVPLPSTRYNSPPASGMPNLGRPRGNRMVAAAPASPGKSLLAQPKTPRRSGVCRLSTCSRIPHKAKSKSPL